MANIALVTASTTHGAATNTKAALERKAHTVTLVADANLGTHDFSPYDIIVACRLDTARTANATELRALVDGGKPLALGLPEASMTAGTVKTGTATRMALCGTVEMVSSTAGVDGFEVSDNGHPVTASFALGSVVLTSGGNWWAAVDEGASHAGSALATGKPASALDLNVETFVVPKGTTVDGSATGAKIVVSGAIYGGQSAYNADGDTLLDNMVAWAIEPAGASTDFSEYATGVAPSDWSPTDGLTVKESGAALGGKYLNAQSSSTISPRHSAWTKPGNAVADVEVLSLIVVPGPTGHDMSVAIRMADIDNHYHCLIGDGSTPRLKRRVTGTYTQLADLGGSLAVAGERWWVRLRMIGSTIEAKAWKDGTTEPSTWQASVADTALTSGGVGVFIRSTDTAAGLDYYSYALDGGTAASPAPPANADFTIAHGLTLGHAARLGAELRAAIAHGLQLGHGGAAYVSPLWVPSYVWNGHAWVPTFNPTGTPHQP